MNIPEAVFADEGAVADQIGRDRRNGLVALEHGFHEIVVGDSLVDKAAPSGIHRDQSRLGTVEHQMREQPAAAVRPHGDRCRRPQPAAAVLVRRNPCAQPLADGDAVAGIPLMAHRMRRHGLRHEGCAELLVVRIAAGRQHHAFSRLDQDLLSANDNARAGDTRSDRRRGRQSVASNRIGTLRFCRL